MWDVASASLLHEYEAHSKRIWSVDFCAADPTLLASGSDDCSVKFWSTKSPSSVAQVGGTGATAPAQRRAGGHGCVVHFFLHARRSRLGVCCSARCSGHGYGLARPPPRPAVLGAAPRTPVTPAPPQLDTAANVCAVRWRPGSSTELAVGSADHSVYLYDLRNVAAPVCTFQGHRHERAGGEGAG